MLRMKPNQKNMILISQYFSKPNFVVASDEYLYFILWPNLKNLSGGLNLSRDLNMVGST